MYWNTHVSFLHSALLATTTYSFRSDKICKKPSSDIASLLTAPFTASANSAIFLMSFCPRFVLPTILFRIELNVGTYTVCHFTYPNYPQDT